MTKRISITAALVSLVLAVPGIAQAQSESKAKAARPAPLAVVEVVQMPAWVERGGARTPLTPGMELRDRDELKTGANSRLLLRMGDGSAVKLGEKGSLGLDAMRISGGSVFEAAMRVAQGAFRFTTEAAAKFRGKREVNITVATVTAGIRGTDLWGKSDPDRQIVCLIEGRIEVTPPGESPIGMDQPLSFYVRDKGQSQPVVPVPLEQLKAWAAETEPQAGGRRHKARRQVEGHRRRVGPQSGPRALRRLARRRISSGDHPGEAQGQARLQRAALEFRDAEGCGVRCSQAEAGRELRAARVPRWELGTSPRIVRSAARERRVK